MSSQPVSVSGPMSLEQFLAMSGNLGYELIRGEPVALAERDTEHSFIVSRLHARLFVFVDDHGLGAVPSEVFRCWVDLPGESSPARPTYRQPDVCFIAGRSEAAIIADHPFRGSPDLVAEVVSKHDRYVDVDEKVMMWLHNGAQVVWVLDHDRRAMVRTADGRRRVLGADDELRDERLLPGFAVRVGALYPGASSE